MDNLKGDFELFKSAISGVALSFGDVLEPKLRSGIKAVTEVVSSFGDMSDYSKQVLVDITLLGTGAGIAFKVFGTGSKAIGKFIDSCTKSNGAIVNMANSLGMSVGQFGLLTGGIGLAVGALGGLVYWLATAEQRQESYNKQLKQSMENTKESIKANTETIKNAKQALFEVQEMENKINSTDNTEEKTRLTEELLEKKKSILQLFPELANGFDSEDQAMNNLNGKMEQYIKLKERELELEQRKLASDAKEWLKKNGVNMGSNIEKYEKSQKTYDDIQNALDLLSQYDEQAEITYSYIDGYSGKVITKTKKVGELQADLIKQQSTSTDLMEEHYDKINDEAEALLNKQASGAKLTQEELKALETYQKYLQEGYKGELGEHNVAKGILESADVIEEYTEKIKECVDKGKFSMDDFNSAIENMTQVAGRDFGELNGTVSQVFSKMKNELAEETLSIDEFNSVVETMSFFASDAFNNLSEASQSSLTGMMESMANGTISTQEFQLGVNSYLDLVANGYDNLSQAEQTAVNKMAEDLAQGKMSGEEFALGMESMQFLASEAFYKLDQASQQTLQTMTENYNNNILTAQEFALGVSAMEFTASEAFSNLDTNAQQTFMSLLQSFGNGEISAQDFANGVGTYMGLSQEAIGRLANMSTSDIQTLMNNFFNGKLSSEELQQAIDMMHSNPDLPANIAVEMLQVRKAMQATENERDTLQGKIDTMKGNQKWSNEFSNQIDTVIQQFQKGEISGDDLQERINTLKDNPNFSQYMTKELEDVIKAMIENKNKGDDLQGRIDTLKDNPGWASLMSGQFDTVKTSADGAKGSVDNLNGSIGSLQNKTVTLNVNTNYTTSGTPTPQSSGVKVLSANDDFQVPVYSPSEEAVMPLSNVRSTPTYVAGDDGIASPMVEDVSSQDSITSRASASNSKYSFSPNNNKNHSNLSDAEKELQQEREKLESDADSAIKKLRDKLYQALKKKIEKQKEEETSIYDARIEALKKEMALLDESVSESSEDTLSSEREKLSKLQAELSKWETNNSAFSQQKQKELLESIKEQEKVVKKAEVDLKKDQLQSQIDQIESEKDLVSKKYEDMLSEQYLYAEANKLLASQASNDILNLIEQFAPDWSDTGLLLGKSLAEGIMESITQGLDGFNYLKNSGNFTDNTNHMSSNTNSSPSNNSSVSSAVDNIVNEVVKQETTSSKKGKVTATNLNVREDAGTNNRVIGSVYKGEEVQILSEKDGWYNINYWSDVYKKNRQGWVSGAYIQKFHTGGIIGDIKRNDEGLAVVQSGERVLSKSQTDTFEKFTSWLPNFNSIAKSINNLNTNRQVRPSSNVTFNNNYEVTNKTEFDVKSNMETMAYRQKQQLRRAGVI